MASDSPVRRLTPPARCPQCGGQALDDSGQCISCDSGIQVLPSWALQGRDRRLFTRRRIATAGIIAAAIAFLLWLNYPFLPDYRVLLFHRPTTEATSASAPGQWTMAGGDLAQRKVASVEHPTSGFPEGSLIWSVPTGQATRSGPVVADGRIYLGGHFKIMSLDARTGTILWEESTPAPVQGSLALAGGLLYAGLLDHRLQAMDPATGEVVWESPAQDIITASPIVSDGIVYVGSWDGTEYALDAATGEEIWTYQATDSIGSHGPIQDGVMAVGDRNGRMHLLNARTGQNRLVYRTPKSAYAAPVIAHDLVFFSAGGSLYAIDANEKEIPGQYQFKRVWAQLWLWQVPGVPRPAKQQGGRWRFSPEGADSSIVSSPAVGNSRLYTGDLDGRLFALDPLTGSEVWATEVDGGVYASPIIAGDVLLVATQQGRVYALDKESGTIIWELALGEAINEPLALSDGVLFARTADGRLHAIE